MTNTPVAADSQTGLRDQAGGAANERAKETEASDNLKLPEGCIPLLPVRNTVLFPATMLPLDAAAPKATAVVQHAVKTQSPIGVLLQTDPEVEAPTAGQLASIGTVAQVLRYLAAPDGRNHLICRGEQRFRVLELVEGY